MHATDGDIGKIDEANDEVGAGWIVIDTGPWIFGHTVILPAGTVSRVDDDERKVYIDLEKDQIKNAPELGEANPGGCRSPRPSRHLLRRVLSLIVIGMPGARRALRRRSGCRRRGAT